MRINYLYIFILVALLPILIFRDYTPSNELRYLSIADEALRNGTFFTFTNQGIPYADKPPLYFWIVMLGKYLLGAHYMLFLSLFSLIPAFVIVHIMNGWTRQKIEREYILTSQLLLLSCGLFLGSTLVLRMDILMCVFITLSLYTFYKMLTGKGNQQINAILFPIYIFLAIFTKGPVGILIPLLCTFVFLLWTKRIRSLGRYWNWKTWSILLILCTIWFGCVYWEAGGEYLQNLLFHQTVDRAINSFHHEAPFYHYFISIWYSMFPWSLLLIGVIGVSIRKGWIHTELQKFFLAVLITTFIMLSFVSSKLDVYLLPIYPFCVYLAAMLLPRFQWNRWLALSVAVPAFVFCMTVPVLIYLSGQDKTHFLNQCLFYIAGGILTITGGISLYILYYRKHLSRTINVLVFGLFCAVFVGGWSLPPINSEIGYGELCREVSKISSETHIYTYYTWQISRPENMDVYLQKEVQTVTWEEIIEGKLHNAILIVPIREMDTLRKVIIEKQSYVSGNYGIVIL